MTVVFLWILLTLPCSNQQLQVNCQYLFVKQPVSALTCNPWPLIQQATRLSLHCDITGPQTNDVPNVTWYRGQPGNSSSAIPIRFDNRHKYFGPVSNGHIANNVKRVNFTLSITNVTAADVGCYWCEIQVHTREGCVSPLMYSNALCLLEQVSYSGLDQCSAVPSNTSLVCAGRKRCMDTLPSTSPASLQASSPGPAEGFAVSLHETPSLTPTPTATARPPNDVRGALYVGAAVCVVLFGAIIALVTGLVVLWKRKMHPPQLNRTHGLTSSINDVLSLGVRPSTSIAEVELVERSSSCTHHQLPTAAPLTTSADSQDSQPACGGRSSPKVHYYHVLERPQYYNCLVQELNLQPVPAQYCCQSQPSTTSLAAGPSPVLQLVPVQYCSTGYTDWEEVGSLVKRRQRPHLYKELEQSTRDPLHPYTKLRQSTGTIKLLQ